MEGERRETLLLYHYIFSTTLNLIDGYLTTSRWYELKSLLLLSMFWKKV